jgi:hypothetical protein
MGMVRAARSGDAALARSLNAQLQPLWDVFKAHSSLRVMYAVAKLRGLTRADPPRPLLPSAESRSGESGRGIARRQADLRRPGDDGLLNYGSVAKARNAALSCMIRPSRRRDGMRKHAVPRQHNRPGQPSGRNAMSDHKQSKLILSRRSVLTGAAGVAGASLTSHFPMPALAQGAPYKVGFMLPYTGTFAKTRQVHRRGFSALRRAEGRQARRPGP